MSLITSEGAVFVIDVTSCTPLAGRSLIRPLRGMDKAGAIFLPGGAELEGFGVGEITSAGEPRLSEGGTEIPVPARLGQQVMYFKDRKIDVKVNGKLRHVVAHPGIIAVVVVVEPDEEKVEECAAPEPETSPILTALH